MRDSFLTRRALGRIAMGTVPDQAWCGWDALGYLGLLKPRKARYDLVIAEYRLADVDGLEILRKARADGRFASTGFLLWTRTLSSEALREAACFQALCDEKPTCPEEYVTRLAEACQRAIAMVRARSNAASLH